MSSGVIVAGLALGAAGVGGRYLLRNWSRITRTMNQQLDQLPGGGFSKYYRGGFEKDMSRREASLILGVSPTAKGDRYKAAHRRIMLLNHPDRGGSPYLASKINEAKERLEKKT